MEDTVLWKGTKNGLLVFYDRQTKISLNHQKKKPMRHPRSIQGGGGYKGSLNAYIKKGEGKQKIYQPKKC